MMRKKNYNTTLWDKTYQSSTDDPIITKALADMNKDRGELWILRTTKADWKFKKGALYFKGQLYIPEGACHELVRTLHELPAGGHEGFFHTLH